VVRREGAIVVKYNFNNPAGQELFFTSANVPPFAVPLNTARSFRISITVVDANGGTSTFLTTANSNQSQNPLATFINKAGTISLPSHNNAGLFVTATGTSVLESVGLQVIANQITFSLQNNSGVGQNVSLDIVYTDCRIPSGSPIWTPSQLNGAVLFAGGVTVNGLIQQFSNTSGITPQNSSGGNVESITEIVSGGLAKSGTSTNQPAKLEIVGGSRYMRFGTAGGIALPTVTSPITFSGEFTVYAVMAYVSTNTIIFLGGAGGYIGISATTGLKVGNGTTFITSITQPTFALSLAAIYRDISGYVYIKVGSGTEQESIAPYTNSIAVTTMGAQVANFSSANQNVGFIAATDTNTITNYPTDDAMIRTYASLLYPGIAV
jgi:hypothetical protein